VPHDLTVIRVQRLLCLFGCPVIACKTDALNREPDERMSIIVSRGEWHIISSFGDLWIFCRFDKSDSWKRAWDPTAVMHYRWSATKLVDVNDNLVDKYEAPAGIHAYRRPSTISRKREACIGVHAPVARQRGITRGERSDHEIISLQLFSFLSPFFLSLSLSL